MTAFDAQPLDLHSGPLMIRASLPLASSPEHCLPHIQFLFIGSRLCSTLLSDLTSRFGPCASLSLHLHLVVKRTCTSKLSDMLGTPKTNLGAGRLPNLLFFALSVSKRCKLRTLFRGDADRVRGVISFCSALSPVESFSFLRSLMSSQVLVTPL